MTVQLSAATQADGSTTTIEFLVNIPNSPGLTLFVFVSGQRASANPDALEFDYTIATLHGSTMTQVANQTSTTSNRFYRTRLYKVEDPLDEGAKPTNQTIKIVASRSLISMSAIAVFAAGMTEVKAAETIAGANNAQDLTINVETEATPSIVLVGGFVRDRENNFSALNALGDTIDLVKVGAGSGQFTSHVAMVGYADALAIDEYTLGWEWQTGMPCHLIALELAGTLESSPAEFYGADPIIILGDVLVEGVPGAAEFGGSVGEIILGSVPPVQVVGDGNLYFSTAARTLTVLLLATSGDNWVIATPEGEVEQLGLAISRRKGYLVPQ